MFENGENEIDKPKLQYIRVSALYMRKMGLEPTQAEAYKNLNLARLPIPTLPHDRILL